MTSSLAKGPSGCCTGALYLQSDPRTCTPLDLRRVELDEDLPAHGRHYCISCRFVPPLSADLPTHILRRSWPSTGWHPTLHPCSPPSCSSQSRISRSDSLFSPFLPPQSRGALPPLQFLPISNSPPLPSISPLVLRHAPSLCFTPSPPPALPPPPTFALPLRCLLDVSAPRSDTPLLTVATSYPTTP